MLQIGVLIHVLTRRGFPSEPKSGVYSACMCSITLCESETLLFQNDNIISLEKSNAKIVTLKCNIRRVFLVELRNRL